jgi:hypothetical protein
MYSFAGGRSSWVARLPAFMPSISISSSVTTTSALLAMNTSKTISLSIVALAAVLVAGCEGPAAHTAITSNPSGASIAVNGAYIGSTPINAVIRDVPTIGSQYDISASKPGYRPQLKSFKEQGLDPARATIPPQIYFELEPEDAVKK